jgi:hypothetical protein
MECDRLDVCQNHILCNLSPEAIQPGDEHVGAPEFLHAFAAVHRHLAGLEVLVDLFGHA